MEDDKPWQRRARIGAFQTQSSKPLLALLIVAVILGCGTTRQKPDQPEVKSFHIEGTHQVSEGTIKDRLLTSSTSWLPFAEKLYFDLNAWHGDLRRIPRIYQAEGFYQARVLRDQITPRPHNSVALTVVVQEGDPTHISRIDIRGLDALPPNHRAAVLRVIPFKVGAVLKEAEWESVRGEIQSTLRELGYAEVAVVGTVYVDVPKSAADAQIKVDPGQRYRFGNTLVATGPQPRVPTSWIVELAQGAARPGSWYSDSALTEAQNRISKLGVFGGVKVTPGAPDRQGGTMPVVVDVRESLFHSIRLGGGVGIDQSRNEARLIAEYVNRDFLGRLRKLTLRGKVGWAFIPNIYSVIANVVGDAPSNGLIYKALSELEQPHFFHQNLRLSTSIESEKGIEQAFAFIGGRVKTGVIWQPHSSFSIFPSYNFELESLSAGQADLGNTAPSLFFGCPGRLCKLSYLEQVITWDRRNDRQEPKKGYYLSLSLQEGGGWLGGSFKYVRVEPDLRAYVSFLRDQKLTIAARIHLGSLFPASGNVSPIISRFYAGGAASMRGFNYRRLSPLYGVVQPNFTFSDGVASQAGAKAGLTVPIGGNGLAESSIEVRYQITSNIELAVFFDTGFVSSDDLLHGFRNSSDSFFGSMQYAVGIGARYVTVVGPIRVDLAYRLPIGPPLIVNNPLGVNYNTDTTCFGLGFIGGHRSGSPEGVCAFHLSIGEAF